MKELIEKSKRVLEFNKIIEILKTYTVSNITKEYIDSLSLMEDIKLIKGKINETTAAVSLIVKKGTPPLFGIHDMKSKIHHLKIGGYLNPKSLLEVSDNLRAARYLKNYLNEDVDVVSNLGNLLFTNKSLEDSINSKIISEEEISDSASVKLSSIRRQIIRKKESIREKLNSVISHEEDRKYLQDSIVTIREGRYVVPVKQGSKSKIKGLVHDVSSSGATVYIEPMAVVNLNNELKTLYGEEREEIEKILKEISQEVYECGEELITNQEILKELDFIFSKGKFSIDINGNPPIVNDDLYVNLIKARHPLIDKDKVVPIDIELGKDFTSLIITGPNTGGKTVTLKTLGLIVLMTKFGLHIPAEENSTVGIFTKVLADIGDEQSIEQSLSTFSSHMVNIVGILKEVDKNSLVLFDELGAGTDPTEGAALARSIMDYMLKKKIRVISTTHYNQLKIYALTTKKVANASMEFNIDTLSPTYKLLIGVPGKSNAFEISRRLGLSIDIINFAKNFIDDDNLEFEKVLKSIEEDRTKIEKHRDEIKTQEDILKSQNEKLKKEIEKLKKSKDKVIEDAKAEARKIINKARSDMELVLEEVKSIREELTKEQARRLQEAEDLLRESTRSTLRDSGEITIKKVKNYAKKLKIGDSVRVSSLNTDGIVLELPDKDDNVLVQVGVMKMKLPKKSLSLNETYNETINKNTRKIIEAKSRNINTEIDVRGQNFDDARIILDKYIDDAYLSGLKQVRIIHGKGTMVLREKIRNYLRYNKHVKSYEDSAYNEGGMGSTIVKFK